VASHTGASDMKTPHSKAWLIALTGAALLAADAQARLYKWVDENGRVHYGDSIPLKYQKQAHDELNEAGLVVKSRPAMPTEEELMQQHLQRQAEREKQRKLREQRQRDRVLLDTYTTERDLLAARDARVEAVDSQIRLSKSIIEEARNKLEKSEHLVVSLRAQGKTVPDTLYAKIEREKKSLEIHQRVADGHIKKRAEVIAQFDDYIKRFRELKAEQQRIREQREARRREAIIKSGGEH